MSYIDNILQKRNVSEPTPFWKLHIYDDELTDLINYIKSELASAPFHALSLSERKKLYRNFDREACLLYALWWSRKYDGGKQSWEEPLLDFGINLCHLEYIKEAVLNELKHSRRLNITIFRSEANFHMYLQSLLAQGGLPMQLMTSEYSSSFENFLYYLISEYEEMDMRDWTNITVAKSLADKYLNNKTLRESEAVLDFSMEIVKAYISNDEAAFSNYEEIKNIISHIREKRGNKAKIERKYFRITWEIKVSDTSFNLLYSVSVPREIVLNESLKDDDGNDINIVSYYIDNRLVGSYHKQGEKYLLMPGTSSNQKYKWEENQGHLVLTKKIKNNLYEEHSLINSQPPYLQEPLLLQYKGATWIPKQIQNNDTYACLIPSQWVCSELKTEKVLQYNGQDYTWTNINWDEILSGILNFTNLQTGEILVLDRSISDYSVSMISELPKWVEYSSESVIINSDDIRSCFKCFKQDEPCSKHGFKFWYKCQGGTEYLKYSGGLLPSGPIVMKVEFPEANQSKMFSFYNITGLKVEPKGKDQLQVKYQNGSFALLADQNIEKIDSDNYQVLDTNNLRGLAPLMFRLYPDGVSKYVELGFATPIQKSCFVDTTGRILEKNYPVALSELHNYKINLSEHTKVVISYYEQTDSLPTCITRKEFFMSKGRYPLDILKDEIERLVLINGFNDYRKYISIRLAGTESELKVRRNAFRAMQCTNADGVNGIFVRRNNEPASNLQLHAIAVNATEDSSLYHSDEIVLVESNEEPGHYYLPELDDDSICEFVVFSDNTLETGNMLPFFLNTGTEMDKESRDSNKSESIQRIQQALLIGNEAEWKNTWFYVDLVIKYRLSYYNSFNTFFAIVNDCYLLSEFLVRIKSSGLLNNYDMSTIVDELQRMERELSFRFHYLPSECWKKQVSRLENEYETLVSQVPALKSVLGDSASYVDSSMSLLEELLKNQFGDDMYSVPIYFTLLGNDWPRKPDYLHQERDYLIKVCDALADFDKFYTPNDLNFIRVEYHKQRPWNRYRPDEVIQKLQYLALVLPQCAAQYVHGADMNLWAYQPESNANEFIRRMINYISIYASEAYNELFFTALLRQPVTQNIK